MEDYLNRVILAFTDTYNYLNGLKYKYWIPFFLSFIFLGWNGLQIVFSLNLMISFVNTRSITNLVYTTFEYHLRTIPIYLFIIISFVVIHWIIHCLFEIGFTAKIHKKLFNISRIYSIGMNFFTPNLILVLSIFFIITSVFVLSISLQIIFSGFNADALPNMEESIYRVVGLSLFLSVVFSMWLIDFVLPRMTLGDSFKYAFFRSALLLNRKPFYIITFYILKIFLIVCSIIIFRIVLRHLLLPFFVMLESQHSFGVFLLSGRHIFFEKLLTNVGTIFLVFLSALIIYSPIIAPLYLYQRFLLFRLTRA